ncbi:MAG: DUF4150 domain-containing protein [Mariprofundaceae bacterium]|nr:DUF4150 domain-containing protein [Mariprofundaceae bacterium]
MGFPDVCKTPAPPQPVVPVAYPNIALFSGDASIKVETKVKTNKASTKVTTGIKKGIGTNVKAITHSIKSGQVATFSPKGKISFRPITAADRKIFNLKLLEPGHRGVVPKNQARKPVNPAQSKAIKPGLKGEPLTQPKRLTSTKPGSTPVRQPEGIAPLPVKPVAAPLPKPVIQPQPLPRPVIQPQLLPRPVIQPQPLPRPVIQPQLLPRPVIQPLPLPRPIIQPLP